MTTITIPVARVFVPLLSNDFRYYGAHGGRGSGKSHFFAGRVVDLVADGERWVCVREVQNSIKDSVKTLIEAKLADRGFRGFDPLEHETRAPNGGLISYRGMQSYNAENIKSLEDYDGVWVEEGQTLSQHSLDLLRPTLRKKNAKLMFSWNPRYKTDAVDKFFRRNPPANAICVEANWHDNPWFDETSLRDDMEADYRNDPIKAEHIWGGGYGVSEGSILGRWVTKARKAGRIHDGVQYDPAGAGIVVSSDLGFRDTASWWFWQPVLGGFKLLAYLGDSGLDADDWIPLIRAKLVDLGAGDNLDCIWLPHDARAKTFQSKHTSVERFIKAFGHDHVRIVPISSKQDRISAARAIIDRCEFAEAACQSDDPNKTGGIDGLEAWEFEFNTDLQVFSKEPLHNWASHPSDAFSYGCQVMQEYSVPAKPEDAKYAIQATQDGRMRTGVTLDELWKTSARGSARI